MKTCTKCGQDKPLSEFYGHPTARDGLGSWCRACRNAHQREYYRTHKGKKATYMREYNKEHRAEHLAYLREYYEEHKEEHLACMREYLKTKKGKQVRVRANYVRRARMTAGETNVTDQGLLTLLEEHDVCPYCGRPFDEADHKQTWDHVVPLSGGGQHMLDNLLPVGLRCNLAKGASLPNERQ